MTRELGAHHDGIADLTKQVGERIRRMRHQNRIAVIVGGNTATISQSFRKIMRLASEGNLEMSGDNVATASQTPALMTTFVGWSC